MSYNIFARSLIINVLWISLSVSESFVAKVLQLFSIDLSAIW